MPLSLGCISVGLASGNVDSGKSSSGQSLYGQSLAQQPLLMLAQQTDTLIAPALDGGKNLPRASDEKRNTTTYSGDPIENIIIDGVQRIDPETVRSYLNIDIGDPLDTRLINSALKSLFATGLFADATIRIDAQDVIVSVTENPVINRIAFEGNDRIEDDVLQSELILRPRIVYTRAKIQDDVKRILEIYRRSGRFTATVAPKIIPLDQNRVDLVFEVSEGEVTGVKKISFVGNSYFSDSALHSEIATKESRWYRFLSNADSYDPDRMAYDRELLRRFYLRNGFADFRVKSAVAEVGDSGENFFLTFSLEEGEQYDFGDIDIVSKIPDIDIEPLKDLIFMRSGDVYDASIIDDTVLALTDAVGDYGFTFVEIRPQVKKDRENKIINIQLQIEEAPKAYVERIDIRGNVRTLDKVLRREFKLVEGDAFNASKLRRTRRNIQSLGFFSNLNIENVPGSAPDKTIVEVDVEEQSTGSLSFGGGYSTAEGALGQINLNERNFLGRGQEVDISLSLSMKKQNYDISFTEPYFLGRALTAGFDLFHTRRDFEDESSYDLKDTGFGLRSGYKLTERWAQGWRYNFSRQRVANVKANASQSVKKMKGEYYISELGQTISYDARDSIADTTKGYLVSLKTDLAGLGGDVRHFKTSVKGAYYFPITKKVDTVISGEMGGIVGIGKDVRSVDRFYLGGRSLRGFEYAGIGPRDRTTKDSLGGQHFMSGTVEVSFPLGLPPQFGIKGAAYTDFGYLSHVDDDTNNIHDSGNLRASVGVGIGWKSPVGPIRLDFAHAFLKENYDETEVFSFNFGTRF